MVTTEAGKVESKIKLSFPLVVSRFAEPSVARERTVYVSVSVRLSAVIVYCHVVVPVAVDQVLSAVQPALDQYLLSVARLISTSTFAIPE